MPSLVLHRKRLGIGCLEADAFITLQLWQPAILTQALQQKLLFTGHMHRA
jgi:hypothetical protein